MVFEAQLHYNIIIIRIKYLIYSLAAYALYYPPLDLPLYLYQHLYSSLPSPCHVKQIILMHLVFFGQLKKHFPCWHFKKLFLGSLALAPVARGDTTASTSTFDADAEADVDVDCDIITRFKSC